MRTDSNGTSPKDPGLLVPRRRSATINQARGSREKESRKRDDQGEGTVSTAQNPKRTSLDSLTALRFFAAFAIVIYHLKPVMPAFCNTLGDFAFRDHLSLGVEFFFVLSGFILYYNYGSQDRLDLKDFYIKRLVRIYPLHLLTLVVWCTFFFSVWGGCTLREKLWSGLANVTLVHALVPGFLFCLGYNAVSWSLSNEAFFYACFPLVRRKAAALAVVSLVATYLVVAHLTGFQATAASFFPNAEYFCPVLRIAEFCAGILAAQSFKAETRLLNATLWEVAVIGAILFQASFQHVDYSLNQLSYVFVMTAAVWVFAHQQGAISKWLARQRLLVLLGEASFSLYMWHHMVLRTSNEHLPSAMWAPAAAFVAVGASIVLSVISFQYFENPVRRVLTSLLLRNSERHGAPVAPSPTFDLDDTALISAQLEGAFRNEEAHRSKAA